MTFNKIFLHWDFATFLSVNKRSESFLHLCTSGVVTTSVVTQTEQQRERERDEGSAPVVPALLGDEGRLEPRRRTGYSLRPGCHGYHTIGDGTGGCVKGERGRERQQRSGGRRGEEKEEEVCRAAWLDTPLQAFTQTDRQTDRQEAAGQTHRQQRALF